VGSGPFALGCLALFVLGIAILYTAPKESARAFAKRMLAFLLDFVFFGISTFALLSFLIEIEVVGISALTAMCVVWAWIALFTICDCFLGGTPGKKAMNLRTRGTSAKSPFFIVSCLGRNLVTFVVPLAVAGSVLSLGSPEMVQASLHWTVAVTVLVFVPLSIVFFEGKSMADICFGMEVLPQRRRGGKSLPVFRWKRLGALSAVSLVTGVLYGFAMPTMYKQYLADGNLQSPIAGFGQSSIDEVKAASGLRQILEEGIPPKYVQDVRVFSEIGGVFPSRLTFDKASQSCMNLFQTNPHYKRIRVQITPGTPVGVSTPLFNRLVESSARFTTTPGLVVFELYKKRSLGVFSIEVGEVYTMCVTQPMPGRINSSVIGYYHPSAVFSSLNEFSWLFLGRLDAYSRFENCPVFPED
jgi:hypothetical protein